jgi:serine-type D-Ala-D-Ala carboxypeptidase/endopeptidase (penicillin-binding protein 4)
MKQLKLVLVLVLFTSFVFAQKFDESKLSELQASLDSVIKPVKGSGIKVSCKVVHADYNKTLYENDPEEPMIPASITKLITCACSYSKLGQSYNLSTIVYTDDNNIIDGVINGNLYLKGFGDPDFNVNDLVKLADMISGKGIKEVTGNIVADESFFDNNYKSLSGNYNGDTGPSYWPYICGLSFNKNEGKYNPSNEAATYLSSELTSRNISIQGSVITGNTPKGAKEIAHFDRPIFDVLSNMCKESDNQSAITMFKLLGAKFKDTPGTLDGGQEVISSFLSEIGINRYSYEILEGSGLTRYNKVNADVYVKLLKFMYDDRFLFDYFMNSLSIAGKDGTLRHRMIGTNAEGNVFAKTGTLNGVSALSGYVIDKDNEILIFYCVMNGFGGNATPMRDVQDMVCIYLASYSRK